MTVQSAEKEWGAVPRTRGGDPWPCPCKHIGGEKGEAKSENWVAVDQSELDKAPPVGEVAKCNGCGKMHKVHTSTGDTITMSFVTCPDTGETYLVGIDGKATTFTPKKEEGAK